MKNIALLGSTGSIGVQTLNVCRRHPEKFNIVSLSAGNNQSLLLDQVKEFLPAVATLGKEFEGQLPKSNTEFYFGEDAFLKAIIDKADIVVVALVGFKGLLAVLKAIEMGKTIALANKESLVVGGELVTKLAKQKGVNIYPIDSEHSAIWQALGCDYNTPFNKLILTASGGAFRDYDIKSLKNVTAKDALKHPNWDMGAKITIDCATMVNKAFEVIEAKWLYGAPYDKIDVIIHRESIIHSMVEFLDSSVIAQMSYPSMELPISLALSYPERITTDIKSLDFATIKSLTFTGMDKAKYPCFDLVLKSAKAGGTATAIINGANEVAVKLFLQNKISYLDIFKALDGALNAIEIESIKDAQTLISADRTAREYVKSLFGV
ncbi:MAG: 1-deoxy-D-xylulose-5-phosphate reductoisomerase [Clostridia bacterium]|nr:1-deoxy-D-xylulose-5-phosphate reductoisomerase [Clostridia bacterium]